jgi:hypothetical protein
MRFRQRDTLGWWVPCGNCRGYENVENAKARFPHFHIPLENSSRKNRGPSFPQFPQGLLLSYLHGQAKSKNLRGEYPIDVWHDFNQCNLSGMK